MRRAMEGVLRIGAVCFIAFILGTGCGKAEPRKDPSISIYGKWKREDGKKTIECLKDGTAVVTDNGDTIIGKCSVIDDYHMKIEFTGFGSVLQNGPLVGEISQSGNEMIMRASLEKAEKYQRIPSLQNTQRSLTGKEASLFGRYIVTGQVDDFTSGQSLELKKGGVLLASPAPGRWELSYERKANFELKLPVRGKDSSYWGVFRGTLYKGALSSWNDPEDADSKDAEWKLVPKKDGAYIVVDCASAVGQPPASRIWNSYTWGEWRTVDLMADGSYSIRHIGKWETAGSVIRITSKSSFPESARDAMRKKIETLKGSKIEGNTLIRQEEFLFDGNSLLSKSTEVVYVKQDIASKQSLSTSDPESLNRREQEILAKVSQTRTGMESMATAMEMYFVDNNSYPVFSTGPKSVNGFVGDGNPAFRMPTFALPDPLPPSAAAQPGQILRFMTLTTPLAYITEYPPDPFSSGRSTAFAYWCVSSVGGDRWILVSTGPDGDYDLAGKWDVYNPAIRQPSPQLLHFAYDPTNGTVSDGDIFRVMGTFFGGP